MPASPAAPRAPRFSWQRASGRSTRAQGANAVWRGALLGALAAVGWRVVAALGWMSGSENALQDAFFRARPARFPHSSIVLVTVDDATVARAKAFPLPRTWHARVVNALARAGAKTIAFDILFSEASASKEDDRALEEACARAKNVVQAMVFWVPSVRNPEVSSSILASPVPTAPRLRVHEDALLPARCERGVWATAPLPSLQRSAVALGHLNAYPEADGVQRRVPPLIRYRESVFPSLPVAAAANFLGLSPAQVEARGRQVLVGSGGEQRHLEVDEDGEVGINWIGGYKAFPTYSYLDVLEGRVEPSILKGRIVLVGSTASGSYDQRATPLAPVQPGLEVQASALNDILLNRPLRPSPSWLVEASVLLLPIALGALVAAVGGRRALGAGGLLLLGVLGASGAAFSFDQVWPVATPLCAMATALALAMASNSRRAWEASWRAEVAVETLARGGSLLSSATHLSRISRSAEPQAEGQAEGQGSLSAIEEARAELARVAVQTLAQALDSPLVLWAREGEPLILAATWTAAPPLLETESASLRLLAAQTSRLPRVLITRTRGTRQPFALKGRSAAKTQPQVLAGTSDKADLNGRPRAQALSEMAAERASEAARALEEASQRAGRRLRLGRQVLLAPVQHEHASAGNRAKHQGGASVLVAFAPLNTIWEGHEEALGRAVVEQALLALENLEFTHALAGRVQAADRELQSAYEVVFEQSVKLGAAIEGIADALLVTDQAGHLTYANAATRSVLRQAAPQIGQSVPQVLEQHGLNGLARGFDQLGSLAQHDEPSSLSEGERIEAEATLMVEEGQAGTERALILSSQLVPLLGREGQALGAMLIVSDVTAQREGVKMKTDFVAFVAHELRSPLTTILGYASLLQNRGEQIPGEQREQMSGVIIQHCKRLNRMISELLDTSRLDAGGTLSLRLEPLDLAALCERMMDEHRHAQSGNSRLKLQFEAPLRPLIATVDADRIEQIVTNLVSNAIKYSPDGGGVLLQVLVGEDGEDAIVRVADEGMGMSQEQVGHLFEKFYRTPDAQKRGIKGTGLGLFLVRQLVLAHGGRIEVQSEVGQGTVFSVFLPRLQSHKHREWKLDAMVTSDA